MLSEGRLTLFSPAVFRFMHLSVKAAYVEIIFPFLYTLVSRQHTDFLTVTFNGLIFCSGYVVFSPALAYKRT